MGSEEGGGGGGGGGDCSLSECKTRGVQSESWPGPTLRRRGAAAATSGQSGWSQARLPHHLNIAPSQSIRGKSCHNPPPPHYFPLRMW